MAEVDQVKLQTVVLRLANLLADDDAESTDYLAKHNTLLNTDFPTQFTSLQKSVGDYDFTGALNTLKQAAAQWQIIW